ncbi:uncharacterized protein LOC131938572 isoform X2 [Physella acuta]|uniref:uncharacterized protein LOC131938572 isoform X2 n=1 Tax=Physella acuta TaxID=109671 RepID=UPI0027DB5C51|nr:uncharacterized protein LOC131938572 isoform X2 [Physella acuta]
MEFLQQLQIAAKLGIPREQFFAIWEAEAQNARLNAETRILQLEKEKLLAESIHYADKENISKQHHPIRVNNELVNKKREARHNDTKHDETDNSVHEQLIKLQTQINEIKQVSDEKINHLHLINNELREEVFRIRNFLVEMLNHKDFQTHLLAPWNLHHLQINEAPKLKTWDPHSTQLNQRDDVEKLFIENESKSQVDEEPDVGSFPEMSEYSYSPSSWASDVTNDFESVSWERVGIRGNKPRPTPGSTVATGIYAEAIALQMSKEYQEAREVTEVQQKRHKSGELPAPVVNQRKTDKNQFPDQFSGAVKPGREVVKPGREVVKIAPLVPQITVIPQDGHRFTVNKVDKFYATKSKFYTNFLYTRSKECKLRLMTRFNAHGLLDVQLLVSVAPDNKSVRWPLTLQGFGKIYNPESKKHTSIWSIDPTVCNRPEPGKELVVPAVVCLTTLRGNYNDVTYELLESKHYVKENNFRFVWNVSTGDGILTETWSCGETVE